MTNNTVPLGFKDGFKRVNPAKLKDDIEDGDTRYIAGFAAGYLGKLLLIVVAAYYGFPIEMVTGL